MKAWIAALVLAVLGIIGAFLFVEDDANATQISVGILTLVLPIRDAFDKQLAALMSAPPVRVISLGRYELPPHRLILYGSLMLFATWQFAGAGTGMLARAHVLDNDVLVQVLIMLSYLVVFPAMFLIGRWVGRRSSSRGLLSVLLIAFLARVAVTLTDVLIKPEAFTVIAAELGEESLQSFAIVQIVYGVPQLFVLGALGYWRGIHQRLGSYLNYLLTNVPHETRQTIVELAFEEAARVSDPKITAV